MKERDRRAVRFGVLGAVALLFALKGVPWIVTATLRSHQEVQRLVTSLARTQELLAATPAIRDSLRVALAGIVDLAPQLVAGRSYADAAATLGASLTAIALQGSLRVRRTESLADSSTSQPRPVVVRAELEGDVRGLVHLLRAVETGQPLLTVRELAITALDPAAPGEILRIEVVVSGLYWAREAP